MVKHKEFYAWITVDGIPLPEYSTVIEDNKATCYVPSEAGKTFVVHWIDEGSMVSTAGYILVDGFASSGRFLYGIGETHRSGVRTSSSTERPFMFAEIPSNASPGSVQGSKDIGTIELKIMQVKVGPKQPNKNIAIIPPMPLLSKDSIDKTGGHYATFREDEPYYDQMELTRSIEPLDSSNPHSYVKFTFYYRSMKWLLEHGLAMLPPEAPQPISKVLIGRFLSPPANTGFDEMFPTGFSEPVAAERIFAEDEEEETQAKNVNHRFASERGNSRVRNQTIRLAKMKRPEEPKVVAPAKEPTMKELLAKYMPNRLDSPPGEPLALTEFQKSARSRAQSQEQPPLTRSLLHRQQSNLGVPSQSQKQPSTSNAYVLPAKSNSGSGLRFALVNPPRQGARPSAVLDTRIYMYESASSSPSEGSSPKITEPPRTPPLEDQGTPLAQVMPAAETAMPNLDYLRLTGPGIPGLNQSSVARLDAAAARQHAQAWQRLPPRSEQGSTYTNIPISDAKQSSRHNPDNIDYSA
ncbi:hypothetical protein EW145_g1151 [Phellinidium pouzarii]|uniref:DUF7918 domain-containing protein n=1 Tax=Phellinidium pouzarii TaxID=167371 RepID=A0A4V3XDR2_9AGAM|nr:hypothetical protein EW145_g1151 [Phellinidium pouzarii]